VTNEVSVVTQGDERSDDIRASRRPQQQDKAPVVMTERQIMDAFRQYWLTVSPFPVSSFRLLFVS